ncbi:MAG: metal ABC transporter permease [Chloroflexi bacterium]|nr:metal ABC transporter permease [Chloroflexota bacterium]
MDFLLQPFQFEFFRNGLMAALMVGALCGMIGVYVVLRNMSYIGHGLSHAAFGGAVAAYVMQWNFYIGAGLWGFVAALLINHTARRYQIGADAAIGIITTASFAVGVALISRVRKFSTNFEAALFGNVLGVTQADVWVIAGVLLASAVLVFFVYKQLLFVTFDRDVARIYGVRVEWVDTLLSLALAATIIVSMQTLGVTLIAAAIVIPPIVARMLTDSFSKMMLFSIVVGALNAIAGMYLSFLVDVASGATIVLVGALLFVLSLVLRSLRRRAAKGRAGPGDVLVPLRSGAELFE